MILQTRTPERSGARSGRVEGRVEAFEYPACPETHPEPAWYGWPEAEDVAAAETDQSLDEANGQSASADLEQRLAEQTRRAFEEGRDRGREEGRRAEREATAPSAAAEAERRRRQASELVENFARERDRYLQAVEHEVVRLALAVAARILRREAQMDPLLLTGAVRVALGQLAATSEIRIRVPAREADLWTETIAHLPNLAAKPVVVAEEVLSLGDCVIESKAGTVDLGIRAQLGEIERGFFDRAGATEASESSGATACGHAANEGTRR
jgi:flagellar assembly protein FliH